MDIDEYKKALSELAKMHEHITGEKLSIECETSQGRRQLAKLVFPNVEGTNENYRLHSCFDLEGVWFTVNASGFYDEKCLELKAAKARIEELERKREPEWVVNSIAELGVKIGHEIYFLYKGGNIQYHEDPHHDEDHGNGFAEGVDFEKGDLPRMMYRPVFKREFGECAHPINYKNPKLIGTVHRNDSEDWVNIPARQALKEKTDE